MLQLAFGFTIDYGAQSAGMDLIRSLFATFDRVVYTLIGVVYQVLFNIADAEILKSETIKAFYGRVEIIIGVFLIFKLAVSIMQSVINPEMLTDQKKGLGQLITRIMLMLVMFISIRPLNIPNAEAHSYNAYLNQHGLLFGTMYSFQARILNYGVIEKIILGNNVSTGSSDTEDVDASSGINKKKSASDMANYVLKGFVTINKKEDGTNLCKKSDIDTTTFWFFGDNGNDKVFDVFESDSSTPNQLLDYINVRCKNGDTDKEYMYAVAYAPVISTIAGLFILVTLLGFCVDIAVRALKLAILRLIAPIPIISYVDPKSSEKGAFANWTKQVITTYLDLFLRLAIVFFVIFLVEQIIKDGVALPIDDGISVVSVLSTIFIIIGVFVFARMFPKFLQDSLGIKGGMSNIGLGSMLGFGGTLAAGGGLAAAMQTASNNTKTQADAFNQGKAAPGLMDNLTAGLDRGTQEFTGNDKMTFRQRQQGRGYLRSLGINPTNVEQEKGKMYELKDKAQEANSLMQRANEHGWASLTDNERSIIEDSYRKERNIGAGPLSATQIEDLERNGASIHFNAAQSEAGKQEKKYNDMNDKLKQYGQTKGYERMYKAHRSNTTVGDLTTREGWNAVFSDGIVTGVQNLASAVPNSVRNSNQNRSDQRDVAQNDRLTRRAANNRDVENSRRP